MIKAFRNMTALCLSLALVALIAATDAQANGYGGIKSKSAAQGTGTGVAIVEGGSTRNEAPDFGRRVPDVTVVAPATANRCTFSVGAGVTIAGFGGGASGTYTDKGCVRVRASNAAYQQEMPGIAKELLCDDPDFYAAAIRAGKPCAVREELETQAEVINTRRPTTRKAETDTEQRRREFEEGQG